MACFCRIAVAGGEDLRIELGIAGAPAELYLVSEMYATKGKYIFDGDKLQHLI